MIGTLPLDPQEVPVTETTKFSARVQISSEVDLMTSHFFEQDKMITNEVYQRVLITVVKPWIVSVSVRKLYVFKQDGASVHKDHLVQNGVNENLDTL